MKAQVASVLMVRQATALSPRGGMPAIETRPSKLPSAAASAAEIELSSIRSSLSTARRLPAPGCRIRRPQRAAAPLLPPRSGRAACQCQSHSMPPGPVDCSDDPRSGSRIRVGVEGRPGHIACSAIARGFCPACPGAPPETIPGRPRISVHAVLRRLSNALPSTVRS